MSTEGVRTALFAWANAHRCTLLAWRYVGTCVEARFEVERDVELRIIAPTLRELIDQLGYELSMHRQPQLRLVRGGRL